MKPVKKELKARGMSKKAMGRTKGGTLGNNALGNNTLGDNPLGNKGIGRIIYPNPDLNQPISIGRPLSQGDPKHPVGSCFAPGRDVLTADGPRAISTFVVGERVLTYDLVRREIVETMIERVDRHEGTYWVEGENFATLNHLFFDGSRWVPIAEAGDLFTGRGESVRRVRTPLRAVESVYNLRTELGTYLLGGREFLVSGGRIEDLN